MTNFCVHLMNVIRYWPLRLQLYEKLAIIGSGDLAEQIAVLATQTGLFEVVGFINQPVEIVLTSYPIIGTDDDVLNLYESDQIDCISIGIGYAHFSLRERLYNRFVNQIPLAIIIHPTCYVDETAKVGEGCVLYPGCTVGMNSVIEDNVLLNTAVVICHDDIIQKNSYISPACNIAGEVRIGSRCMIGIGTTIIDHKSICEDVIIGAGAVVISDITISGTYVGVPAKKIK